MDPNSTHLDDPLLRRAEELGLDDIIRLDLDPDDHDDGWHQGAPRTTPDRSSVGYRGRR
jgi:hypothetical protein